MATGLSPQQAAKPSKTEAYVATHIEEVQRRIRTLDLTVGICGWIAIAIVYALIFVFLDRKYDLPANVRQIAVGVFGIFSIVYLYYMVWRPYRRRVNPYYAALQVEHTLEASQNSLINWLDLRTAEESAQAVRGSINKRAARDLGSVDPEEAVSGQNAGRMGILAGILAFIFLACMLVLGPGDFFRSLARTFIPFNIGSSTQAPSITILRPAGGDAAVPVGQSVTVTVEIAGMDFSREDEDAPRLFFHRQPGEPPIARAMEPLDSPRQWEATVSAEEVQNGFWYRVKAGNVQTPQHQIKVHAAPLINDFRARYNFREYLGRTYEVRRERKIDSIAGTEVVAWARTNRMITTAHLEFENKAGKQTHQAELIEGDPRAFQVKFELKEDGFYRLHFTTSEGETYADPAFYPVIARPDQAPTVQLTKPGEDTTLAVNGTLQLEGEASDDIGVKSMTLRMKLVDGAEIEPKPYRPEKDFRLEGGGYPRRLEYRDFVALPGVKTRGGTPLMLQPGMEIEYWLEAADACDQPKPHVGESKHYKVKLTPPEDEQKQQEQKQEAQQQQQEHNEEQDKNLEQENETRQDDADRQQDENQQNEEVQKKPDNGDSRDNKDGKDGKDEGKDEGKDNKDGKDEGKDNKDGMDEGKDNKSGTDEGKDNKDGTDEGKDEGKDNKGGEDGKGPKDPKDDPNGAQKPNPDKQRQKDDSTRDQARKLKDALDRKNQEGDPKPGEGKPDDKSENKSNPSEGKPSDAPQPQEGKPGEAKDGKPQDGQDPSQDRSAKPSDTMTNPAEPKDAGKDPGAADSAAEKKDEPGESKSAGKDQGDPAGMDRAAEGKNGDSGMAEMMEKAAEGKPGDSAGMGDRKPSQAKGTPQPGKPDPGVDPKKAKPEDVERLAKSLKENVEKGDLGQAYKDHKNLEKLKEADDPKVREAAAEALNKSPEPNKSQTAAAKPGSEAREGDGPPGESKSKDPGMAEPDSLAKGDDGMGMGEKPAEGKGKPKPGEPGMTGENGTEPGEAKEPAPDGGDNPGGGTERVDGGEPMKTNTTEPPPKPQTPVEQPASELQLEEFRKLVDRDILKDAQMTPEEYEAFLRSYADLARRQAINPTTPEVVPPPQRGGALPAVVGRPGSTDAKQPSTLSPLEQSQAPPGYREAYREFLRQINRGGEK